MVASNDRHQLIAENMYRENLWWTYQQQDAGEQVAVSEAFRDELGREVSSLQDIMGIYTTTLLSLKIDEALKQASQQNANRFLRFVASFETVRGKRSYQNQMQVIHEQGVPLILVTCIDITEMVELEREIVDAQGRLSVSQVYERQELLEQQNKVMKESYAKQSRFLALLSHELRSPLLGISSLVKRLRNSFDNSPEIDSMLKTISMTAEQSTYLVNDILTYTQTEYDGVKLHPSRVELKEILENVKLLTKSIANDKGLNLSVVQLTDHNSVMVDSVRLTQILINLIINGIKFTQFGGVNLEVKEVETGLYRFTISDSGEGIPEERLHEVFEPFAQVDSGDRSRKQQYLGAGLGLFVVKQLVELMGGEIHIFSQKDVGTQFQFTLNLNIEEAEASRQREVDLTSDKFAWAEESNADGDHAVLAETSHLDRIKSKSYKVLVADDAEINRMVLAGYLDDLDCQVVEAADGRVAWQKLQEEPFDYVLLDIQMPKMDGVEVAKALHKEFIEGLHSDLKGVFAITAGGDSSGFDNVDQLLKSGAFDEWLVKPVNKSQIIKLLKKDYRHQGLHGLSKGGGTQEKASEKDSGLEKAESNPHIDDYQPVVTDIPEAFHHLVLPFIEEMTQSLEKLAALNKNGEAVEIKKLAHYMKGNVMLFQLNGLVGLCKQLEKVQTGECDLTQSREQETTEIVRKMELAIKSLENSLSISHNSQ